MGVIKNAKARLVPIKVSETVASVLEVTPENLDKRVIKFNTVKEWGEYIAFAMRVLGHYNFNNHLLVEKEKFSGKKIAVFETHPDDLSLGVGATVHKYKRWGNKVTGTTLALPWENPTAALDRSIATLKEAELLGYELRTGILPTNVFVAKLKPIVEEYNALKEKTQDRKALRRWAEKNVAPMYLENLIAIDGRCTDSDSLEAMRETVYKTIQGADRVLCPSPHDRNKDHLASAEACADGGRSISTLLRYAGPEYTTAFTPTYFICVSFEDFAAKMLALQWHQDAYSGAFKKQATSVQPLAGFSNELNKHIEKIVSERDEVVNARRFYFNLDYQLPRALHYGKFPKNSNNLSPVLAEGLEVDSMSG